MDKVDKKVRKEFLNNYILIFLIFLVLLKPYFLSFNYITNMICNIFLILFSIVIYFCSFYKNKISKYQKILFIFLLFGIISTAMITKDYSTWFKNIIKISSISLYTELLIKQNLDRFLLVISTLLYILISITFFTTLIVPSGIFGHEILFLGYDNSTIILLIFGSMIILFSSVYFYQKYKKNLYILLGVLPFIMSFFTYVIRWSVGALIGCLVILILFCVYFLMDKLKIKKLYYKIFNIRNLFIISIIVFLLIVVLGVQKYFSFIIVDIFNKDITLTNRTYIWEDCFDLIKSHILFGNGIIDFESRLSLYGVYHAHSNFLNIILETGIIGFFIYLCLWKFVIKSILFVKKSFFSIITTITFFSFFIMTTIDVIENCEMLYVFLVIGYFLPYIVRKTKEEKNNLKNILMIIDSGQPVPAINGGAIETLIDSLIKENEKQKKYNIEVYSTYDKAICNYGSNEKCTKYKYIDTHTLSYFISRCFNFLYKKLFKAKHKNVFSTFVLDEIEIQNKFDYYDRIIIENTPKMIVNFKQRINSEYILHVHNDINNLDYTKECFDGYNKIICCSNFIADRIKTVSTNDNIVTVYNGVAVAGLEEYNNPKERKKLRKKYNIPNSSIVFGYCGRLCEDKGTKELIEAFKIIASKNRNVFLVLTGNSFFKNSNSTPYIESLVECSKGFADRIIFTGYFEHSEIGKFYSMIDIYVQPSIVNEACPLTIIESQIMNKIILTTNSGGIPELIKNNNVTIIDRKNLINALSNEMTNIINKYNEFKKIKINKKIFDYFDETTYAKNILKEIIN